MLCQNETGVLLGSEIFFNTVDAETERLFYYAGCCGHYYCERGYKVNRKYMDCLLLMLIENGSMRMNYRGRQYTAQPGDLILLDGTFPQYYDTAAYVEFFWLHLSGGNSIEFCEYLTRMQGGIVHRTANSPKAAELLRRLVSQFATGQAVNDAEQSRLLYSTLCWLAPGNRPEVSGNMRPVQQAIRYIQEHLGDDLSLKRLAAEVHISPPHLIRLFRAELQHSPHEYVIQMRMNRAKHLLKTTMLPIKAIAAEVGYGSESSFTGAFTERIGISPKKFRELPLG